MILCISITYVHRHVFSNTIKHVLTYGTIETTIEATKLALQDDARDGGFILSAGSDILGTNKYENVKVMIDTVKLKSMELILLED